jgi:SP family general alpha glucoside:H+ symporter-like MFS transporter
MQYINEHSPVQMRGFLIVAYSLWFSLGGLFANIVLKVRNDQAPLDWRTTIFTQFAMIGISYIVYWFMPESPQWAVRHGKVDLARRILTSSYKGVDKFDVDKELNIMLYTVEVQKQHDSDANLLGPLAIFKGLNGKRFLIGAWPKILQQFVGLAIFSTNAAYFFQIAGKRPLYLRNETTLLMLR